LTEEESMFDLDRFIEDCCAARGADPTHKGVREVLQRAVAEPAAVLRAVGEPKCGGVERLYHSDDLTILNVTWSPLITVRPHNHRMWALIGVYTGREDNVFWRRLPDAPGRIEAAGAKALCEKDAEPLGADIIHSVTNPIPRLTGAIHIYGGDFYGAGRSEWDAETLVEREFDFSSSARLFQEFNAKWGLA
jgi:predicted metal-dependent enzyme (double-stranded beta helix superfamily)